jgi:hypothetical protein
VSRAALGSRKLGYAALEFAKDVCAAADPGDLRWFVPFPDVVPDADGGGALDGVNVLRRLTFDRVPGFLYVGPTKTLNRMLVEKGLASSSKGGELGT